MSQPNTTQSQPELTIAEVEEILAQYGERFPRSEFIMMARALLAYDNALRIIADDNPPGSKDWMRNVARAALLDKGESNE